MAPSPKRLREHRDALIEFRTTYAAYLNSSESDWGEQRARVSSLIPKASAALYVAGVEPMMYPPPAIGGVVHKGLVNVVFLHDRAGYGDSPRLILDILTTAIAQVEIQEEAVRRRRRNPLYWGDRLLRATLGFPAYLISIIFGVPLARIEESPYGPALRVAAIVIEGTGVFVGGRAAGVW